MPLEMHPCVVSVPDSTAARLLFRMGFSPSPDSYVDFDSCWVPRRRFGDFAFGSLVSFYFPPLLPLTDRRAPLASGLCYFFFLGPWR